MVSKTDIDKMMDMMGEDGEVRTEKPIISSLDQLNNFVNGPVWTDIQEVINLQITQKYIELESVAPEQLLGIQEAIKQLRFVLAIPEMLLEHKDAEKENLKAEDKEN